MKERHAALEQICQKSGIAGLYAFGSQAEGVRDWLEGERDDLLSSGSDIDIGVRGMPQKRYSVSEKVSLSLTLEDLFGGSRVDLVLLSEADPFVAAEIIRGERLYVQDEYDADEYDLYILRRAGDLAPLERERMALVLGEPT
jgi:predicted nucleotidyltransferase